MDLLRLPLLALAIGIGTLAAVGLRAAAGPSITGIRFDWPSYRSLAPGSDDWPLTWCEDGHQYTSWGDGGGFGGTNTDGRVSLGFGRISGPYSGFSTVNLWGGENPIGDSEFSGKVISMLCLNGHLYAWHGPGSASDNFEYQQLIFSDDKGITWNEDAFPNSRVYGCAGCPGLPYMINYGRNYGANRDGYVYTYWIKIQNPDDWDVQIPGVLWLARAPVAGAAFTNQSSWQWLTGFNANGTPRWGAYPYRSPVLQDAAGLMRGSAIFTTFAGGRYLMVTNHTTRNDGNITIWESPAPWGPWSRVLKHHDWPGADPRSPVDSKFSFGNFAPAWFGPNGAGVFVWFGPDRWNSVAVTLLPEPGGWPQRLCAIAALAVLDRARRVRCAGQSVKPLT